MEIVEDFVSWTRLMPSKHFNPFIHYFSIFLTQYSRPTILITPHPEQEEQRREQGGFNKELPQLLFAHNSSISRDDNVGENFLCQVVVKVGVVLFDPHKPEQL